MNSAERRDRIVEYLRIKSISHGQVYTFQIAVPESETVEVPFEKREYLRNSLTQQGTNLIPLIVRRTEAYSEEEEYEVVYGADWCLVAKELDIEKLWVWVFDMTDVQAAAAKEEMQQLLSFSDSSDSIAVVLPSVSEDTESTTKILKQLNKLFLEVETLNKKIEQLSTSVKKLEESPNKQTNIDIQLVQQFTEAVKKIIEEVPSKPLYSMKKDQLQEIARKQGIKITTRMTKTDILNALEKADKSHGD
ncbi:MAG: Rho termination factor N-terminal domain-containing protein [Nostoc sp. DedQUE04]|uniref:Rho termination factor N-terminal domain-containing protein n=1 Tax=Nostoc sp. DedQUE04 TaxID=3075390 RepID=UPI002AD30711|nr:Rho termination factor N-terminal domain-containing protein [Nostoc sp. DedQUE04]MDZ8134945.1 Rho termination factor N-terminal domain-containing protein [Nostoc sp. DedQUE04]